MLNDDLKRKLLYTVISLRHGCDDAKKYFSEMLKNYTVDQDDEQYYIVLDKLDALGQEIAQVSDKIYNIHATVNELNKKLICKKMV